MTQQRFDYIIIGAGSAGSVLARRPREVATFLIVWALPCLKTA